MAEENKRRKKSHTNLLHLLPDILLLILARLDHEDRLSLSLVSKSFRSFTNRFVHKLTFNRLPSESALRKLFVRFSSVNRIAFHSKRIGGALTSIANSALKIEGLEIHGRPRFPKLERLISSIGRLGEVKSLKLEWFRHVRELQVIDFIHLFRSLEELDMSKSQIFMSLSDAGIEKLALKSPNLRRINLDGNWLLTDKSIDALANCVNLEHISLNSCRKLTDRSLDVLSNCASLEHIRLDGCTLITLQGFCTFVRKRTNLKSLEVPVHFLLTKQQDDDALLVNAISSCENLSHLSIGRGFIRDSFLSAIANSRSPLTSLEFKSYMFHYGDYTMTGFSTIIRAFQGLSRLHIYLPGRPLDADQDTEIGQLVGSLRCLKDVCFISYSSAYATLFSLIHNCPLLESIHMESLKITAHYYVPQLIRKNYSVQRIFLCPEPDNVLKEALISVCPSLKILMM